MHFQVDWNQTFNPGMKLFILPVDVILKNSIALSYFIDFMTSIGSQSYLFFYLNVEGWKVGNFLLCRTFKGRIFYFVGPLKVGFFTFKDITVLMKDMGGNFT